MKIIVHSNSPLAGSGYGQQTDLFTRLMVADGHDVKIAALYGLQGKPASPEGIEILPTGQTVHSGDVMRGHIAKYQPDLYIGLYDMWIFDPKELGDFPYCWWTPIDCDPIPPKVADRLQYIKHPWAMSRFGERKMREAGLDPLYVPHGIDIEVFKPLDDRAKCKRILGVPEDAFLFVTVAANKGFPSRKNLPQMIKAFAYLLKDCPDCYFYIHSNYMAIHDGIDLERMAEFYGIPDDRIIFPSAYDYQQGLTSPEDLNVIYNAGDAFVLPSAGEGFGIPVIEAQAAGTPVIVSDFTAQSELCGSGIKIEIDPMDDLIFGLHYSEQANALSTRKVYEAMKVAATTWKDSPFMRKKAREFALQYDHKLVYQNYMKPAIQAAYDWNTKHRGTSAGKYAALGFDYHWSDQWQNPQGHYVQWVKYQLSHLPENGDGKTVLDFGCGDGYPASLLAKRGYKVIGVENVEGARKVAEKKVPEGQFFAEIPADMRFDYVVALDVIEHIENRGDMQQLISVINDVKELALISTPPPGIDQHAVQGFTVRDIKALFPEMRMDVLECSRVDQLVMVRPKKDAKEVPAKMKIAVLASTRHPIVGDGANGIGNSAYEIASGLAERGHDVTLCAGEGSSFSAGELRTFADAQTMASSLAKTQPPEFDVFIDITHGHLLSTIQPDWAILNRMGDGECRYNPPNKIIMTEFLRKRYGDGRLIKTGIKTEAVPLKPSPPAPLPHGEGSENGACDEHVLFIGRVHELKGIKAAMEAARLANVPIKFVGPNQSSLDIETQELTGKAKWDAIHKAKAVLLPGGEDFAPRMPLEVAAAGVPVLTMPYDGTGEHVKHNVTGFVCHDVVEMAEKIKDVDRLHSEVMRKWIENQHSYAGMIDGYVKACQDVIRGERW